MRASVKEYLVLGIIGAIVVCVTILFSYFIIYKKIIKGKKTLSICKLFLFSVFICYLIIIAGAVFLNRGSGFYHSTNLHLFSSYKEAWNKFSVIEWRNLILNILLFIPMGIFLPLLSDKFKVLWKTLSIGFIVTILIECAQYQEAYEQIKEGKFKFSYYNKLHSIEVESVVLDYKLDSKGFFQPVYEFYVRINGNDSSIVIPALKK